MFGVLLINCRLVLYHTNKPPCSLVGSREGLLTKILHNPRIIFIKKLGSSGCAYSLTPPPPLLGLVPHFGSYRKGGIATLGRGDLHISTYQSDTLQGKMCRRCRVSIVICSGRGSGDGRLRTSCVSKAPTEKAIYECLRPFPPP